MRSDLTLGEQTFIDASLSLATRLTVKETCAAVLDAVERIFDARASWVLVYDRASDRLVTCDFRGQGAETYAHLELPCDSGILGLAFSRGETVFIPDVAAETRWYNPERVRRSGLQSVFALPLVYHELRLGVVGLDSPRFSADNPPSPADLKRLRGLAAQAAIGIRNARLFEESEADRARLRRLLQERRQLRSEVGQLRHEVRDARAFSTIVGEGQAIGNVLAQVEVVAPADSTVLVIGETGTGKELVARAIHDRSRRASNSFVAVNCAALPEALVESELFGHEKGAFTGAIARKVGKFELADRGTLFLDEIGDLPVEAQAKLLRVLQEREVQRVGATRAVRVNVRLVAATNQDLAACMQAGRFRPDLYYRLSVFPVRLPPLRERREDIPPLADHFIRRFAERLHKPVPRLTPDALQHLVGYEWPGNVRELQNVIERAVILVRGPAIGRELVAVHPVGIDSPSRLPSTPAAPAHESEPQPGSVVVPFSEAERRAIVRALNSTGWRISGRGGAAEILGLRPTTLHAKMKKLGIHRPSAYRPA